MRLTPLRAPRADRGRPARSTWTALLSVLALILGVLALAGPAQAAPKKPAPAPSFGPNTYIFDPSMPTAEIQARADAIWEQQRDNEMGSERYSLLFKPGTYGTPTEPLQIKVGYYTEVAGLGANPGDVVIEGKVEVYNRCFDDGQCFALNNFWRTLSNLTVNINGLGQDGCRASGNFWAVSQAVSMRRVRFQGANLSLMDYCTAGPQFASGGFIADTQTDFVINGSQQQWLTRNSIVTGWSNAVWNQVFSGVVGAPDDSTFPNPPYTTLEKTSLSREKPYLFVDGAGAWQVRVPSAQRDTSGTSWAAGLTAGRTLPLSSFFVARPGDSIQTMNAQLARGKNLLLTPGLYDASSTLKIKRAGTVVLGMGHATLTAVGGAVPVEVGDKSGIVVAGITVDAGETLSPVLMRVGKARSGAATGHDGASSGNFDPADPTTLSDVYFRVGGPHIGKAETSLEVNSDDILIDHTWVWRADHGIEGFGEGQAGDTERWNTNIGTHGVIVNGDDVTATGLFVEHYQEHNTIWNGERGEVVLYQNELPYDPPTQADWTQPDGTLGYAGFKVADTVSDFELWGGGSYVYNRNNPDIVTEHGFEVPVTQGVRLHHLLTVNLGAGTIRHVVNDTGDQVDNSNTGQPRYVVEYP